MLTKSSINFAEPNSSRKFTCAAVITKSACTKLTATKRCFGPIQNGVSDPVRELRVYGYAFWLNKRAFDVTVNHERSFSTAAG
ncbi:hypothetical protein CLOM_g7501 [Closterium sp. NIES-68]|nr:hypothetical protein CLOM_g7501 [Closterium sp. NIES-68]GJP80388.1 hypothetical protein CLOP_g10600 [Closterium sp. NIES-67]